MVSNEKARRNEPTDSTERELVELATTRARAQAQLHTISARTRELVVEAHQKGMAIHRINQLTGISVTSLRMWTQDTNAPS